MMKRTLSLLLALIMVVGLLPNTLVFAVDANDDIYIDESSSLEELEDLGIVDIPEDDIPDVDGIPEDEIPDVGWISEEDDISGEDAVSDEDHDSDVEIPDVVIDNPETSPLPKEPDLEHMEENSIIETPDSLPEGVDDSDVHQETASGSLSGTFTADMTVSYTTRNGDLVWKANATGANVDQDNKAIDTYDGYPYYDSGIHTIQIVPDTDAASAEGVTQLHVNLYQVQVRDGASLSICLDETAFAAYPNVTEVVLHSVNPERSLLFVSGGSLTLEGLPGCRLVLDGAQLVLDDAQSDSTITKNRLLYLGSGSGVGSVNVNYVTFRNAPKGAVYAAGGHMDSVTFSNCYFEDTCTNTGTTTSDGAAIVFASSYSDYTTAVASLTISDCCFDKNKANRVGGAVCLHGFFDQVNIENNDFIGNSVSGTSSRGGALGITGYFNQVKLTGNTYSDCFAARGGAIAVRATVGSLTVSDTFEKCSTTYGGALYITSANVTAANFPHLPEGSQNPYNRIGTLSVTGSQFNGCTTTNRGAAISLEAQISKTMISNSSFENCSAGAVGGGICFSYTVLPEDYVWGLEDSAADAGLDVSVPAGASLRDYVWSDSSDGIVTTMGVVSIEDTTFDGCNGTAGGGVYIQNCTDIDEFKAENIEVKECQSTAQGGGGLALVSTAVENKITLTNVKLYDNVSAKNGGGLYINVEEKNTVSISGSQVYGNIAGASRDSSGSIVASRTSAFNGDGGGIYLTGSAEATVTISDSIIGAKLQDTESGDGETVQTPVSAPNYAYLYVKETVVTEATDGEPAQIKREPGAGGRGGGLFVSGVKLELKGTKVLNNEADYTSGGIGIYTGAILSTDSNTDVSYNTAPRGGGIHIHASSVPEGQYALEMVGSTVSHNRSYQTELVEGTGGGIYMAYTKAMLVGVTVSDNICANVVDGEYVFSSETVDGLYGGGLAVYYKSTLEFYGGSILRNQASEGAGIALYTGSTLSLMPDENGVGVQVKDNTATGRGGGIHVMARYGTLANSATIEGATITGNKAGNGHFGGDGGGIAVSNGGTLEIINTEIGNNSAGVGYVAETKDGKTVYVNGEPKWILAKDTDDNPAYTEGGTAPKEIYGYGGGIYCFGSSATIRGCEIHNNTSGRRGGGVYGENGSSIEVYNITAEDGTVTKSHIHHNKTRDYAGGIGAVGHIVKKTDDEGKTIKENNITVIDEENSDGATLRLDGTLVEYNETTRYGGGGIYISSLAVCDIVNNAVVQENTSKTHAGGIMANIWGAINVTDAQVIRNKAGSNGGGVYVSSHSEVVITDGEISHNTAAGHGGGVVAGGTADWGGSGVTIIRGEISYNTAGRNGGGVYAVGSNNDYQEHSSTVLIKDGTTISYNKSEGEDFAGGGVYVGQLSTVTIEGGLITENTATGYGGGVTGNNKATVTVAGGQVFQNYAGSAGGIYVGGESKVYVNDGLIKKNIATAIWKESTKELLHGNGGGVMATDSAQIIITGGEITENEAKSCEYYTNEDETEKSQEQTETCTVLTEDGGMGGGVYATGKASVLLEGGSVTQNEARCGGGIYAGGASTVTMEPKEGDDTSIGSITGNTATLEGGGIYATGSAEVTLTDGIIQSNTAKDGGGIYAGGVEGAHSTVTVDGGQIGGLLADGKTSGGNTADGGNGGGIYAICGAEVTVNGGQITKNRAKLKDGAGGDGGGIYASGALDEDENYISGSVTVTGGEISANTADGNGGGIYATITSSMLVNGGDVKKNQAVNGGGICSNNQASVTVQGGSVAENTASQCGGGIYAGGASTVTMEPKEGDDTSIGSITGNTASVDGGGIYVTGSAQVTLTKGNIQSNTATTNGGGICATGQTDSETAPYVYVNGGTIEKNTAKYGGGICGVNSATVLVDNGKIIDNEATCGGGLCVSYDATATVNGGEISDNSATSSTTGGGGIYVANGGTVAVSGGELKNNTAKYGGGLFMYTNATVSVSAGKIINNQATNGGGGVYMYAGSVMTRPAITITGGEISGNIVETGNGGGISATGFFAENVYLGTRTCKIEINGGTISGNKINGDGFGGGIALDNKSTCTISNGEIYQNSAVNGGGIYAANNSSISITGGYIGAKLLDKNDEEGNPVKIVQDASNTATENGGGIYATDAARVTLIDGIIQSNTATANGGGIYADGYYNSATDYGGATVTVSGGTITGNKAGSEGAGIYATGVSDKQKDSCGQVTISGGTISGNKITGSGFGGGIATRVYSQVTLKGGTVTENTAPNGGGIYATEQSTVTIQGGFVQNNNATVHGGGIYAAGSAQVSMEPKTDDDNAFGSIIGNTAGTRGGGVYATDAAQVTLRKGIIKENSANYGGGIFANGPDDATKADECATVLLDGGTVEYNTAKYGGGICISSYSVITILNGLIAHNTASHSGGGIYAAKNSFITVKNGEISGNKAAMSGGGAALAESAQLLLQGGEISGNTANGTADVQGGGGLYVYDNAIATIEGGEISGNTALGDGGGIFVGSNQAADRASVTITKISDTQVGTVKYNTADNGGGVCVYRGGTLTVNEGHIFSNSAVAPKNKTIVTGKGLSSSLHGAGGGICVMGAGEKYYATFTLTGTKDDETKKMNVGIYGNTATLTGDEVFSNGTMTKMTIPLVREMKLDGYELDIVGWFEDYNTSDKYYYLGLNRMGITSSVADRNKVKRYRNSTATERQLIDDQYVNGDNLETGVQYVNLDNAYVAMALGIPAAFDDTVVVDYGTSVSIDILANDMLLKSEDEGMNPATDSKLGLTLPDSVAAELEILYSPKLDANNQDVAADFKRYLTTDDEKPTISILNRGTAEWKKNGTEETGVLTYTMNSMELDTPETFYYVVPGEKFYYYGAVNVVPATSIYFEDNCGMVTYHTSSKNETLAEWEIVEDEGSTAAGSQEQDRPGASSILAGLDANNIYGYDSNYVYTSNYSGGSAYKVSVNQHNAQDKIPNGYCDFKDKVTGEYCRRKLTHTFENNGSGKCIVCLNTEDKHSNDIPSHECTDGNNHNEYCNVCSQWIGTHTTKARASFTFTGTGFDIVSLCTKDTGMLMVNVYRGEIEDFYADDLYDNYVMSYFVDTCYGYKKEGDKWVVDPDAKDTYYQVPVIKCDLTHVVWYAGDENNPPIIEDFGYGTYTVEIIVGNSYDSTSPNYENAEFYLDAIRIYNPAGIGGSNSQAAQDAYKADGEGWPTYAELRTLFISQSKLQDGDTLPGIVFIDGEGNKLTLKDYKAWGPNNEIYLMPGQSIAFTVDEQTYGQDVAGIHLGVRGLNGRGNVLVQAGTGNNDNVTVLEKALSTTDLYYDISNRDENGNIGIANKTVTISNPAKVDGVDNTTPIAISTLKVTHNSEPSYEQSGAGQISVYGIEQLIQVSNQTVQVALEILTPEQLVDPIVTPKSPALSFNGMVCYNVFFTAEELGDLTADDLGMAVFDSYDPEGTVDTAKDVIMGATQIDGQYMIATNGIHAKYLGDTQYFRVFAKKADGTYVYSKMVGYSAVDYAKYALEKSDDVKLKQLVVAMLNYGAEAQKFFGYKTDDLMNKDLTADDQALLAGFEASSLNAVGKVDASKVGVFASTGGFTKRSPAISFKGAFEINYFFTPANAVDGDMTLYFWNEDTYNSVTELTAENADKAVVMTLENGTYTAASDEIAAKYLDKTVYVAAVYESDGVTYCSGVLPYSIAAYCQKPPATVQDLAAAAAIYGCTAKQYFGV